MIVINFKTYPQASGDQAVQLAKICGRVSQQTGVKVVVGVQATDIQPVCSAVKIPVFGQHADPLEPGRNTGWLTPAALKEAGARGVFLNHSEHQFSSFEGLEKAIGLCQELNLETLVFVKDNEVAKRVDQFNPRYIALEEPALVSSDTAMIKLPKFQTIISEFVKTIEAVPLVGAGIKTKEDVFQTLKLGVKGVALASGLVKVDRPEKTLTELASAF